MGFARFTAGLLLLGLTTVAHAQSRVPDRQVPPSVLTEVRLLENRFDIALSIDCDAERCFSKGCTYVDHTVADRPRSRSLPGLGGDPGPGSVDAQEYLTSANCAFAYEDTIESGDVQALSRRLQSKLSKGWTTVSVSSERLQPIPQYVQEAPEPVADTDEPEEEVPVKAPEWSATRELWSNLLPHFYWMVGIALLTVAGTLMIWAWRRVGRESIEDQMLLAELARGDGGPAPETAPAVAAADETTDAEFVAAQQIGWSARLDAMDPAAPDVQIQALIRELLRSGDLPLLAKAVLTFPDTLPAAFPTGGEVASAKLELAEYLKTVEPDALPSDADFFRRLNRHALSAAVASQSDAQIVRSLREEFGAGGLASLISGLGARAGALLFALAPADEQREMVRLLAPAKVAELAEMLLLSNRMDADEMAYLFAILSAARAGGEQPEPMTSPITDRGAQFEAGGALSALLENVNPTRRAALFGQSLERFQGSLPTWYRGIFVADMLFELSPEARTDLLLELDVPALSGWLSLVDAETRGRLIGGLPDSLRASIQGASVFPSRTRQVALAEQGRRELARGFQLQLARVNLPFESVVQAKGGP